MTTIPGGRACSETDAYPRPAVSHSPIQVVRFRLSDDDGSEHRLLVVSCQDTCRIREETAASARAAVQYTHSRICSSAQDDDAALLSGIRGIQTFGFWAPLAKARIE
jgi:alkylhydroperoxidase family enzyme